jgi:hypothetical protein
MDLIEQLEEEAKRINNNNTNNYGQRVGEQVVSPDGGRSQVSVEHDSNNDTSVVVDAPLCPPHPSSLLCHSKSLSQEKLFECAVAFLCHHSKYTLNCPHIDGSAGKTIECSCFSLLKDGQYPLLLEGVAHFMSYYCSQEKKFQQQYVMQCIRYGNMVQSRKTDWRMRHCKYMLPIMFSSEEDHSNTVNISTVPLVCRSLLQIILGKGRHWWNTCT